jgi:hypothetical protein
MEPLLKQLRPSDSRPVTARTQLKIFFMKIDIVEVNDELFRYFSCHVGSTVLKPRYMKTCCIDVSARVSCLVN